MKVTKRKGFNIKDVFHEKKEDKGVLSKIDDENDYMENKFKELASISLSTFIKDPVKSTKEENKKRREGLKEYFKNIEIYLKSEEVKINDKQDNKNTPSEGVEQTDLKESTKEIGKDVFNNIIKGEAHNLECFKKKLEEHKKYLEKVKKSLNKNKSQYKVEQNQVSGTSKRNKFYDFYAKLNKLGEYKCRIEKAFDSLYSKNDILKIKENLTKKEEENKKEGKNNKEEKFKKKEFFDSCKAILGSKINKDIQTDEGVTLKYIEGLKDHPLTQSRFFYKYYLSDEKNELTEENIKYCFPHFIEIEMHYLLRSLVKLNAKQRKEKAENIFKSHETIKCYIKNKLKNKLILYIQNSGKIKEYHFEYKGAIESSHLSDIRKGEGFIRNVIGATSSTYFSFRNIVNPKEEDDLLGKCMCCYPKESEKQKAHIDSLDIYKVKQMLAIFYGDYFYDLKDDEVRYFLEVIKNSIYDIRNNIIHFNKDALNSVFEYKKRENDSFSDSLICEKIVSDAVDVNNIKLKILQKFNSANVFNVLSNDEIKNYFNSVPFNLGRDNIGFVPSFYKVSSKINDNKDGLELGFETFKLSNDREEKEKREAQIFLLKQIYYNKFLEYFLDDSGKIFEGTKKNI